MPRPRQRAPLLVLGILAVAGVALARFLPPLASISGGAVGLLLALVFSKRDDLPAYLAVFAGFVLIHGMAVAHREEAPRWHEIEAGTRPLATVTGSIRNMTPPSRGRGSLWNYDLHTESITTGGRTVQGSWRILLVCPDPDLGFGDLVEARGTYSIPAPPRNPGGFDRRAWILREGYAAMLVCREKTEPVEAKASAFGTLRIRAGQEVGRLRAWLGGTITRGLENDPETCAILHAITLGDRAGLPDELEETFQNSGTLHLFAVSGLHVAMVAGILLGLTRLLRLPGCIAVPLVLLGLVVYTMATGMRPSAVRATVMVTVYWAAVLFDRNPSLLNTLGLAALTLLAMNTWDVFSIGFQLSFAVMVGIGLLGAPLRERLRQLVEPDAFLPRSLLTSRQRSGWKVRRAVADNIAISCGAWAGSILPVLLYFGLVTPVVVIANLFLIYPAFLILWIAGISLLFGSLGLGWFAVTANHANWLLIKLVTLLAAAFAALPGGHFFVPIDRLFPRGRGHAEVTVFNLDTGGGAAHIAFGNNDWLLDCGDRGSPQELVLPHLYRRGTTEVDGILLTHGDSRHVGGVLPLAESMPETLIFRNALRSNSPIEEEIEATLGNRTRSIVRGDRIPFGGSGAYAEVLFPPAGFEPRLADDGCLVVRVVLGEHRLLFVSDSGLSAEHWLLENEPDLGADVLIMGRHESDFCGDLAFVRTVSPQVIIATNSRFPEGQSIPEDWPPKIAAEGILLLDQRRSGAVTIEFEKESRFRCRTTLGTFERWFEKP